MRSMSEQGRTYENMSKQELITLVKRLTAQHEEWRRQALEYADYLTELGRVSGL